MLSIDRFQVFLDCISDCFINCDFSAWEACVDLPFSIVTTAGTVTIDSPERLRENFEHYLTACRVLNIDAIVRKPLEIQTCSDGKLLATYETELLTQGYRATAPYQSSALLVRQGLALKMTSILNARGHHAWTGVHLNVESVLQAADGVRKPDFHNSLKPAS